VSGWVERILRAVIALAVIVGFALVTLQALNGAWIPTTFGEAACQDSGYYHGHAKECEQAVHACLPAHNGSAGYSAEERAADQECYRRWLPPDIFAEVIFPDPYPAATPPPPPPTLYLDEFGNYIYGCRAGGRLATYPPTSGTPVPEFGKAVPGRWHCIGGSPISDPVDLP